MRRIMTMLICWSVALVGMLAVTGEGSAAQSSEAALSLSIEGGLPTADDWTGKVVIPLNATREQAFTLTFANDESGHVLLLYPAKYTNKESALFKVTKNFQRDYQAVY